MPLNREASWFRRRTVRHVLAVFALLFSAAAQESQSADTYVFNSTGSLVHIVEENGSEILALKPNYYGMLTPAANTARFLFYDENQRTSIRLQQNNEGTHYIRIECGLLPKYISNEAAQGLMKTHFPVRRGDKQPPSVPSPRNVRSRIAKNKMND